MLTSRPAIQRYPKGVRHLAIWLLLAVLLAGHGGDASASSALGATTQQAAGRPALTVVALGVQEVYLSWSVPATVTGITGFEITRDGKVIATLDSGHLNYTDTTVSPSTSYIYRVDAMQGGQNAGPTQSKPVHIKTPALPETPDTTPPSSPDILELEAVDGRIILVWSGAYDDTDITGYVIRRNGEVLAVVNSGTRLYTDTEILPLTDYEYTVEAMDVVGHHSSPADPVRVTSGASAGLGAADQPLGADAATAGTLDPSLETDAAAGVAAITSYSAQLLRYPYLTDVVGPYATINWATDRSLTTGSVRWGRVGSESCTANTTAATRTPIQVNSVLEYQWKAQLTLQPGIQYCYRVFLGGIDLLGSDPSPTFFTQVPAGSTEPFTFAVIGDWGSVDGAGNNPQQANLMAQLAASGARFALTTGDNTYLAGSQANYGDLVQTGPGLSAVFGPQFWARVGTSMPLFPAIGDHGFKRSDTYHPHLLNWPQDRAVATSGGRYQIDTYCCVNGTFSDNYPSTWYAFDAGVARFYVLQDAWPSTNDGNADEYANDYASQWTPASAQYQWLANDLATHPAAIKFAFFHYPLYSDSFYEGSDTYLQGANSLEGLLSRHGVSIAFNGHAHIYQRNLALQPPLLITYLTGGGGATLQRMDGGCSAYDAYALGWSNSQNQGYACGSAPVPATKGQVFHFLLVTVNGNNVTVRGVNSLGQTFDQQSYTFRRFRFLLPTVNNNATVRGLNSLGQTFDQQSYTGQATSAE